MMRSILLIACVCCLAQIGLSQDRRASNDDEKKTYTHSLGLNATGLIQDVFGSENDAHSLPYLFTYELELQQLGLRVGVGPSYTSETVVHEGFSDSQELTDLQLDGRIGVSFRLFEEDKWRFSGGVDVVGQYVLLKTIDDTGFDKVTDQIETESIGLGPFVQIAFQATNRISIRTESALYARRFKTTHTELFENFPDFNNELSKTTGTTLDTFLPTSIFIHLHF